MIIVEGYSLVNGIPLYDSSVDGMKIYSICDYNGWGIIMKKDNEGRRIDVSKIFTPNKEAKLPKEEYKFAPKEISGWENTLLYFLTFLLIVVLLLPSILCIIAFLH